MEPTAPPFFLTEEQTAAIKAEDDARKFAEAEEGLAQIEEQWPEALKQAETAPADAPHSMRLGAVEALVHAREHVLRQLGGEPERTSPPQAAKGAKRRLSDDAAHDLHRRGGHLHGQAKALLVERKRLQARKAKG